MDKAEIYKEFVSKLEKKVSEDAERCRRDEERAGKSTDDGQRDRMTRGARFYGEREHKTMVIHYNKAISVLAQLCEQKFVRFEPKYCPE